MKKLFVLLYCMSLPTSVLAINNPDQKLAYGSVFVGNASGLAKPVNAKTSGYMLIGNGTTLTSADFATAMAAYFSLTRGYVLRGSAAGLAEVVNAKTNGYVLVGNGTDVVSADLSTTVAAYPGLLAASKSDHTSIDFTKMQQCPLVIAGVGGVVTNTDTQVDVPTCGWLPYYLEVFQDKANSALATTGMTSGTTGWLLANANAAEGIQITEGIVLGSAHSFLSGTSAAFYVRAAFRVPTLANTQELMVGFRKLAAYETAETAGHLKAAYDDKILVGIEGTAGAIREYTSKATSDVGPTTCTHAAPTAADILALEVDVSAAGVTSVKVGNATPAGTTAAQIQAAVTAAYAALTADTLCNAAAITLTATNYVPTIISDSPGSAATADVTLVNYYAGLQ